jgi:hypothetical protein
MPSAGATGSRPEPPTLFIDRNSGGRSFRAALQAANIEVVLHDEVFSRTTPDEIWIAEVGQRGWLAVTAPDANRVRCSAGRRCCLVTSEAAAAPGQGPGKLSTFRW